MKKITNSIFILSILIFGSTVLALQVPWPKTTIYNSNIEKAIDTNNIDNPIRDGTFMIIDNEKTRDGESERSIWWVVNIWQITEHDEAKENVLQIIKNIINYALGMLWLVALVYLIAHWFMMVTAAGDDEKYKKWLKGLKYAAIALIGIGVSFFLMSFIFRLVKLITISQNG